MKNPKTRMNKKDTIKGKEIKRTTKRKERLETRKRTSLKR